MTAQADVVKNKRENKRKETQLKMNLIESNIYFFKNIQIDIGIVILKYCDHDYNIVTALADNKIREKI